MDSMLIQLAWLWRLYTAHDPHPANLYGPGFPVLLFFGSLSFSHLYCSVFFHVSSLVSVNWAHAFCGYLIADRSELCTSGLRPLDEIKDISTCISHRRLKLRLLRFCPLCCIPFSVTRIFLHPMPQPGTWVILTSLLFLRLTPRQSGNTFYKFYLLPFFMADLTFPFPCMSFIFNIGHYRSRRNRLSHDLPSPISYSYSSRSFSLAGPQRSFLK